METIEFNKTKDQVMRVLCPDCKKDTRHVVLQSVEASGIEEYDDSFSFHWGATYQVIQCRGCSNISFRSESSNSEDYNSYDGKPQIYISLFPRRNKDTLQIKDFFYLPINLKRIYREIIDCYNNEIYTLCAAGLRAIIDGICFEEGIKEGPVEVMKKGVPVIIYSRNLEGKIAGLHERGILTKKNSDILHKHRVLGNEAVHALALSSKEELELAIQIVEHVLEDLYVIPQKAKELKSRKAKRQAHKPGPRGRKAKTAP